MSGSIEIGELSAAVSELLRKDLQNAGETLDEVPHMRAMQYRDKLRLRSPKDTGEYAGGWRIKKAQRNHEPVWVIYNAAGPELTFMLEYGTYRQAAQPHIRPALEETVDEIIEELVDRL